MKVKQFLKIVCFIGICVAVGMFLYSHMNEEYSLETDEGILTTEMEKVTFPETYQKTVSDLLQFDVIINMQADPQDFYVATATRAVIDEGAAYNLFMGEEMAVEYAEEFTVDMEYGKVYVDTYMADGKSLSLKEHDFSYFEEEYTYVLNSFFVDDSTDEYNSYLYSTDSDLDFMDREVAWESVKEDFEKIGLDMSTAMQVVTYSLDAETMEREEVCIDVNGNEVLEEKNQHWSKEDDGYHYYITQNNQGMPLYLYSELQQDNKYDVPLRVFQTNEGIIFAYLERWFNIEIGKERLMLKPFEDIMAVVEEKYSGTIRTNPLTVDKATLYTFPVSMGDGNYSLVPVWVCSIAEKHMENPENIYISYLYMGINAVTGEEVY